MGQADGHTTRREPVGVRPRAILARFFRVPHIEILLLLVVGLGVGIVLADDYGLSPDEYLHEAYAEQTIDTYLIGRSPLETIGNLRYYGPAFSLPWLVLRRFLVALFPSANPSDLGHFLYFLAYLAAILFIYLLGRRLGSRSSALTATILFATQPLLFAHGFINPKDTPFLAAFLLSVWAGFKAVDASRQVARSEPEDSRSRQPTIEPTAMRLSAQWRAAGLTGRAVGVAIWLIIAFIAVDLFIWHRSLAWIVRLVEQAYQGAAWGPLNAAFAMIAQDAWKVPVEDYVLKAQRIYGAARIAYVLLAPLLGVLLTARVLRLPLRRCWSAGRRSKSITVAAGIALGYCAAIRVFGLYAGVLVSCVWLVRQGRRAAQPLALFWLSGIITTYVLWPFLWAAPLQRVIESIMLMSRPPFMGLVLFEGRLLTPSDLPAWHLPKLLLLRLTPPALLFAGLGVLVFLRDRLRRYPVDPELVALLAWIAAPLAVYLGADVHLHDAARQVVFLLPPLFLIAVPAFDAFFRWSKRIWLPSSVVALCLAPGLVALISLHPYEQIYFNALAGGVRGAFRTYELDSWCTSYREAIEYVNAIAAPDSRVGTAGAQEQVSVFARPDLQVVPLQSGRMPPVAELPPFNLICTINLGDLGTLPEAEVIWAVERAGVPLTVVKRIGSVGSDSALDQ
jgi:hypothetical protein